MIYKFSRELPPPRVTAASKGNCRLHLHYFSMKKETVGFAESLADNNKYLHFYWVTRKSSETNKWR